MISDDPKWFQMIPHDPRWSQTRWYQKTRPIWSQMGSDDPWWWQMTPADPRWPKLEPDEPRWFPIYQEEHRRWSQMSPDDTRWAQRILDDPDECSKTLATKFWKFRGIMQEFRLPPHARGLLSTLCRALWVSVIFVISTVVFDSSGLVDEELTELGYPITF